MYWAVLLMIGAVVALESFLVFWIPFLRKEFQWLIIKSDQTPAMPETALKRFFKHSFDPELGWVRKPYTAAEESQGTVGERRMGSKQSAYRINRRGARENPGHEDFPARISVYGDSFVFCRQVNDDETWPWFLSKLTQSNVLNFGVGNYGFDQALLRFRREYPANPTRMVIIGVVPETITRILSVWKHYYEYGNTLGFKPRFRLIDDQLTFIPNVMRNPEQFSKLASHLPELQRNDYFYSNKFTRDLLQFPYLLSLLRRPSRNLPLVFALSMSKSGLIRKLSSEIEKKPWRLVLQQNSKTVHELYTDSAATSLFLALLEDFRTTAESFGCTPVFLLIPYLHDVQHARNHGVYYSTFLDQARMKLPVIDIMDSLIDCDELDEYYSSDFYGGHMTVAGNRWCSDILYDELQNFDTLA
jgi:hypothetical protein